MNRLGPTALSPPIDLILLSFVSIKFYPDLSLKMSLEACGLSPLPGETRLSHLERIRDAIQEWNANRLDLFEITPPNDDFEFYGAMRFYFQVNEIERT